jgi:hypothetical protein
LTAEFCADELYAAIDGEVSPLGLREAVEPSSEVCFVAAIRSGALAPAYIRRERRHHTLQPTALVHEAYLRLVDQTQVASPGRAQFFAIAANLRREILVNHARDLTAPWS